MSHNLSFPTSGNLYQFPALNTGVLYINGKKFEDYITELVFEDQLEQSDIDEIKLLLQYLNTSGLSSEWIVDNNNKNQDLKTLITALETKLANIDTTALTESSVLTNENRNSVLKTAIDTATSDLTALTSRVTTAEGDIDGVETKTRFITEATITGTGDNTVSTYTTLVGPADGVENGSTAIKLNVKNAPSGELIGYEIKSNFNNDDYAINESTYSHYEGRLTLAAETIRIQATDQCRIGTFKDRDGFSEMDIKIGGQGNKVNIASVDEQNLTGPLTEVWIGKLGGATSRSTEVSLEGNIYVGNARFPQLGKSTSFTITSLLALMASGAPAYVIGFFSGASALPYSDVWCMKGGFLAEKKGDVETSNSIMVKELYVVNKDIVAIAPKIGFFLAKADYSCTQLIGDHRTQVFEGEITLRNNNITSTDVDWVLSGANDSVNVVNIGGDSGILIHQGASEEGEPLRIINSCGGSVKISLHDDGTHGFPYPGIEVKPYINGETFQTMTRIGFYPGQNQGNGLSGSYQLEVNQEIGRDGIAVLRTDITGGQQGGTKLTKINGDSINTQGTITGYDLVGTTSVSAPTVTATSLVINANYTGDTTNRLYKNADGKLFWNGVELGANLGGGGGGLEYYIPLANNVINPAPNPTAQIATETYTNAPQRTITQSTTAVATGLHMARYVTAIINKESNPFVEGLQTIQQYLTWSENNTVGQLYGECWFQAEATGGALVYERSYTAGVTTNGLNVLSGTPILAPNGLFNLSVKSVVFPDINVDTFNGATMTIKCRLEARDPTTANWTTLQTSTNTITYTLDNQINQTLTFTEDFVHNQTTKVNAPTAYRFVLFTTSPDSHGHLIQTNSGAVGGDQIAYRLGSGSGDASIRVLLYDGVNAKQSITHSTTPLLVPIELPISPPYQTGAFNNGRLAFDIFMYQPSGAVNVNHQMRFFFGEGTITHIESTINEPPAPTPTLSQVLNSGATASQDINMNSHKISGITTLEGAANGNWNVKEITAGTNISVSPTNGSYAITNNAPTQDVAGGTGIQIAKNGTTATITNNAPTQDVAGGTGIQIAKNGTTATITNNAATQDVAGGTGIQIAKNGTTATITNNAPTQDVAGGTGIQIAKNGTTATITNNAAVQSLTAGTGISIQVDTATRNATITNTVVAGGQAARDQLFATSSVGLVPNKLGHYAQNWTTQAVSFQPEDIFVSHDGRNCVYIPAGGTSAYVQYSLDYGLTWVNSNFTNANFVSICGSTTGEVLYISKFDPATGSAPNVLFTSRIYVSYNYGVNWSELSLDRTPGAANTWYNRLISKIRCSADGSVVIASTFATTASSGVPNNGTLYISTNGGSTWVVRNITASIAQVADCCMSSNGTIMFASMNGVLGGSTDNGNGGIYRSFDYGATWTKVRNQIAAGTFFFGVIKCDATGRFLVACDQSQTVQATGQVQTSDDYGTVWTWFGDEQARGANAAFVSPGGNLMITAHDATENSRIRYSTDYGRNWITAINFNTVFTLNDNLGGATLRTIASNHDGSVILMRANTNAVYRGIEERGRLALATTSRDLTITPAFGGGYTILNNPSETLWFSGAIDVTTKTSRFALPFTSAGKIDLANYHIRYEIDINWNLEQTQAPPNCYISMGFYGDYNTNSNVVGNNDVRAAHTIWTRKTNVGTGSFPVDIDSTTFEQAFNNVFLVGYAAGQGTGELYRYRTIMKGEISRATTRPAQYSGDFAPNSRLVMNRFYSDAVLYDAEAGTAALEFYHPTIIGQGQHHIQGTGVWEMSRENKYSVIQNGIDGLLIDIYNEAGFYSLQQRGAYATYRIYRVRK